MEHPRWKDIEALVSHAQRGLPETLRLRETLESPVEEISLQNAKAIFFVNSFEGKGHRQDIKFYTNAPIIHGIWAQAQFQDGEIIEGIVHNSMHHLIDPGFFLLPSDPESNNRLVYVVKAALKDYRVLGLRPISNEDFEV